MHRSIALISTLAVSLVTLAGCTGGFGASRAASPLHRAVAAADTDSPVAKTIQVSGGGFGAFGGRFEGVGHVVITGGIGDYGTTGPSTAAGKPNPDGNYIKFTLGHGTFLATDTHEKSRFSKLSPQCTTVGVSTFDYVLSHGTGQYADITGTLKGSVRIAEVEFKATTGHCPTAANRGGNYYDELTAHGTIKL